jgi:hypothetical protein
LRTPGQGATCPPVFFIASDALFAAACNAVLDRCAYLCVTAGSECPRVFWTSYSECPALTRKDAY